MAQRHGAAGKGTLPIPRQRGGRQRYRKIQLQLAGERRRDFLTFIRQSLKDIHNSFAELKIQELDPPTRSARWTPLHVDYQEPIGYEKERMEDYFSGKLRKRYKVADLLNGIESPEARQFDYPLRHLSLTATKTGTYMEALKPPSAPCLLQSGAAVGRRLHLARRALGR